MCLPSYLTPNPYSIWILKNEYCSLDLRLFPVVVVIYYLCYFLSRSLSLSLSQELDYESCSLFTLLVVVENEVAFSGPVSTSTATVTVTVEDRNEAPVFKPAERVISVSEDLPVDSDLAHYTATDPDLAMSQTIRYSSNRRLSNTAAPNKDSQIVFLYCV